MKFTAADLLTLLRVAAIAPYIALMLMEGPAARWGALAIFIAAALSDAADGWLARRAGGGTPFGQMLDPIADKLLTAAALVMLIANGELMGAHAVAAYLILARELAVSGLREHLGRAGASLPVSKLAKWKTALQFAALAALTPGPHLYAVWTTGPAIAPGLLWAAMAVTLVTGADYFRALFRARP